MSDKSLAFGSRCEGAAIPNGSPGTLATWVGLVATNKVPIDRLSTTLTRIYAFDHFIHNHDRHPKNFLATQQPSGMGILAFDYSRAWTFNGLPLPALPFDINDPAERTVKTQRCFTNWFGSYIDAAEASTFLNFLKSISIENIKSIINMHPKEWLPDEQKKYIISWWSSAQRSKRLDEIAEGIGNGSYL
jgi:hypothetical protein